MAKTVIAASLELDSQQATQSVKSFKQQLKEANTDLVNIQSTFGATSKEALAAAKSVAALKDKMQEAKEVADLFDPGAKFQVFGNVLRTAAGGMSALTGAMGLLGGESKVTEEALLKVQSALALTEGVNTIVDAAKDFERLKAVAVDAFKAIKAEISATGIGLFVVALGLIVTYWDNIKNAIGLASAEQLKAIEVAKKEVEIEQRKLDLITSQNNLYKEQGKSQQEILDIEEKQLDNLIQKQEKQLEAQKVVTDQAVKSASRIRAIFALGGVNFGNWFADPKDVKAEGDKTNAEMALQLAKSKDQKAGYHLESIKSTATFNANIRQLNKDAAEAGITDAYKLSQIKLRDAYEEQVAQAKVDYTSAVERNKIISGLTAKYRGEALALAKAHKVQTEEELRKLQFDADNARITDQNLLAIRQLDFQLESDKRKAKREISNQEELNKTLVKLESKHTEQVDAIRAKGLQDFEATIRKGQDLKRQSDADAQQADEDATVARLDAMAQTAAEQKQAAIDLADEIGNLNLDAAGQQAAASMKQLNDWYKQRYAAIKHGGADEVKLTKQYEKQKSEIARIENNARLRELDNVLGQAAGLFEKNTIAYKVFAIAQATINTWLGVSDALAAKSFTVFDTVLKFANVAVIIAAGLQNVAKIVAVDIGGTSTSSPGGGAAPSAPLTPQPQVGNTQLPQAQLNQINNAANPVRAFVVESDVTTNQQRVRRLNRAAKLGS